jgi:hypothetical protein
MMRMKLWQWMIIYSCVCVAMFFVGKFVSKVYLAAEQILDYYPAYISAERITIECGQGDALIRNNVFAQTGNEEGAHFMLVDKGATVIMTDSTVYLKEESDGWEDKVKLPDLEP